MRSCSATCASPVVRCAPASDRQPTCLHSSLTRSGFFRTPSTSIWPRSGPVSVRRSSARSDLDFALLGRRPPAKWADALLPQAIANDRLAYLAELVMQTCRQRQIVVPSPAALERLCAELRNQARREAHRRLTQGLSAEQRQRLDALTQRQKETGQSWLTWLRQMPEAAKPTAMLGLIERLEHVRAIGIEPGRGHLVYQARLAQLAREAGRTT